MKLVLACVVAAVLCAHADRSTHDADECVIELECDECLPDNMPLVAAPRGQEGARVLRVPHGDQLALSCGAGHFLLWPRTEVHARCEHGAWLLPGEETPRALLELGCQHDVLEDVQHAVPQCAPPLQGRAYLAREAAGARHLAALCYDSDRALTVHARISFPARGVALGAHSDARGPLSLLGNFEEMFDASTRHAAERLFSDEARTNRRLRELLRPEGRSLGGETLVAGPLLAAAYFPAAEARAARFASNLVLAWSSVAAGNLRHLHADVAGVRRAPLAVVAGTLGELAPRGGRPLRLGAAGRFPVPRYIWTAVYEEASARGVALVLLNDPFVTVSEIRAAVFCDSVCGQLDWLHQLRRHRNYERPLLGLVFCCRLPEFARSVPALPGLFPDNVQLLDNITLLEGH